uniref:Hypothetical chloroplast protein RF1 n=1 Tax=Chlorosarcinopsis eremi TaxID=332213 RepID=A0A5C2FSQ0_9CHLO|nr:hypothetical chloroplast protein RF1 [Chlorosarcinopsis eremi]
MIPILSLVTSVKDYLEVVHKFVELGDPNSMNINYTELGSIITFFLITIKNVVVDFLSLSWLKNIWSLPIIIPDISSAMISEISILDGYFHNAFNFLDTPISYGNQNSLVSCVEKLIIGLINSFFLFLPTSTAHIITLRRFVMQGLDAGYISGLGTIAGNLLWLASIIFGWRFFVIPWLSLDIFRYVLGFILLVKYMWDSYNERRMVLEDVSKRKIFLLNFLLAITEQTSIYPFISNLSISPEASILESFPTDTYTQFIFVHFAYLLGIALGSLSLLHFTCWFWENPAFKLYMWVISSFKVPSSFYHKVLNFTFLYLTMLSAISSIPYYGLDYTITNPLGYVNDDRIIQDKVVLETSFLGSKASDRNTRRNRGRHGRRERWKRRIRKYRTFDASLYDQGIYDLFTIEDLNYGFDRFWLRRKLRNHRVRFRFFPGPWMRSFKKQLAKPRLESYTGPRIEFFRILFEQVYHPSFHAYSSGRGVEQKKQSFSFKDKSTPASGKAPSGRSEAAISTNLNTTLLNSTLLLPNNSLSGNTQSQSSLYSRFLQKDSTSPLLLSESPKEQNIKIQNHLIQQNLQKSTLRKFVRKLDNRLKKSLIVQSSQKASLFEQLGEKATLSQVAGAEQSASNNNFVLTPQYQKPVFSKQWKTLVPFSKISSAPKGKDSDNFFKNVLSRKEKSGFETNLYLNTVHSATNPQKIKEKTYLFDSLSSKDEQQKVETFKINEINDSIKKQNARKNLSKKDLQILRYRSLLLGNSDTKNEQSPQRRSASALELSKNVASSVNTNKYNNESLTLLHPLKFYLQREAGLNRKLRYYSPNIYRKFSVENNAPYFRVMMRRYFYNYKPTLRWERTMKVASLRKARRKTARIPRKLQYIDNYAGFVKGEERRTDKRSVGSSISANNEMPSQNPASLTVNMASLQKPTYNYSVVSKRASRYRYQIYKDVLQHWYYSPFNRLLLKFDVDNFIRRQPNAHFLNQKEENLLHLRRFLLSEHYNTLRWYTNMEHYRSMKTNLNGSTKSFSSRAYNQQFSGTFKKIRHLFAITPSQGNVVLKFDQPLYNEFPNNSTNPLENSLIIHEELLGSPDLSSSLPRPGSSSKDKAQKSTVFEATDPVRSLSAGEDLLSQSQNIVRNYLIKARPIREEYIKQLLNEKNYTQLTQFIYKGFKTRGDQPVTSQRLLNNQEKEYLLTASEKETEKQLRNFKLTDKQFIEDLYLTFLKKWKRRVNDQEALKNYLTRRMEKREKRKQKKERQLLNKLKKLEVWAVSLNSNKNQTPSSLTKAPLLSAVGKPVDNKNNEELLTSGLQKAIFDGVYALEKNKETSSDKKYMSLAFREESQTEKNLWKALVLSKIQSGQKPSVFEAPTSELKNVKGLEFKEKSTLQDLALRFKNLKFAKKQKVLKDIKTSTIQLSQILQTEKSSVSLSQQNTQSQILNKQKAIVNKVRLIYSSFQNQLSTYLGLNKMTSLFKEAKRKSLKDWRKKERALGKQKRSRKEFKLLNKKTEFNSTFLDRNEMELALQTSNPLRKKRIMDNIESTDVKLDLDKEFNEQKRGFSFKRKRSPQRRSRVRRNRGVFKKRTLTDSLKKDFKNFYKDLKQSAFDVSQKELQGNTGEAKLLLDKINKNIFALKTPIFIRDTDSVVSATSKQESEKEVLPLKQRKAKQRKQRYWKQKRAKYSQKRRKYRKRRRYAIGKIRSLSKQFKRIKNKVEIQNWWWKQFIPSIQASTEALWQIENDKLIQQKLSQLSSSDILERDQISKAGLFNNSSDLANSLQVGNRDFKPLALPETIRLKEEYLQNKNLSFEKSSLLSSFGGRSELLLRDSANNSTIQKSQIFEESTSNQSLEKAANSSNFGVVNKLYENLFINRDANFARGTSEFKDFTVPNTGLPFYAGWDESLRKFVVTNRLLSRKEAGYEIQPRFSLPRVETLKNDSSILENSSLQFNLAPLQGMNAATTLYWQIPFTTYDPDQFFALGMDGFSPIGWRKFLFRHSILKTWLNSLSYGGNSTSKESVNEQDSNNNLLDKKSLVVRNAVSQSAKSGKQFLNNSLNNVPSLISLLQNQKNSLPYKENRTFDAKNISRRLKKRYRRVKKHPRTPVWFPSGPLLNQVLPVHYIYVFYKRARLPRDRYLKRRLLKIKDFNIQNKNKTLLSQSVIEDTDAKSNVTKQPETLERLKALINTNPEYFNYDFTLRKRLKPKRKYHLKRDYYSSNVVIPRRFKFMGQSLLAPSVHTNAQELTMKWRPVSSLKLNKPIFDLVNEQKLLRSKQRRKELSSKQQQPNLRVKQLRRRVQRQILRSVWRYRPRAGGFVWPGDYLKLEQVKAPKLQPSPLVTPNEDNIDQKTRRSGNVSLPKAETQSSTAFGRSTTTRSKKQKRKKKRTLVEWQIQPKKYLYEKHNLKVLKRKLEKAQRFDKINLKVKELNYKL